MNKNSKNDRDDYIDWIANKLGKVVPWQLINAETFGNARKSSKLTIPENLTKEEKAKFIEDHVEARRAKSLTREQKLKDDEKQHQQEMEKLEALSKPAE